MILINGRVAVSEPLQWSDRDRENPTCYIVICPWCHSKQWTSVKYFYIGIDNSKVNYQCKFCRAGLEPRLGWDQSRFNVFNPKCAGWLSI